MKHSFYQAIVILKSLTPWKFFSDFSFTTKKLSIFVTTNNNFIVVIPDTFECKMP